MITFIPLWVFAGFEHSAYVFAMESNLVDSDIDCTEVASGALVMMVQVFFYCML